jgi:transcriptional regulator with XRE-family HTH domain
MPTNGLTPDQRLAARIAAARVAANITQMELAVHLEVSLSCVSQWEQGHRRPTIDNLRRVAVALGVSLSELLE